MIETFANQLEIIQGLIRELEVIDDSDKVEFADVVDLIARKQQIHNELQHKLQFLKQSAIDIWTRMLLLENTLKNQTLFLKSVDFQNEKLRKQVWELRTNQKKLQ